MITLCALVGGCFVLTVMGFVIVVPLGWSLVLSFGLVNPNVLVAASRMFW